MRSGYFRVAPEMLAALLHLPEGNSIEAVDVDHATGTIRVYITGGNLPEWKVGEMRPEFALILKSDGESPTTSELVRVDYVRQVP